MIHILIHMIHSNFLSQKNDCKKQSKVYLLVSDLLRHVSTIYFLTYAKMYILRFIVSYEAHEVRTR